MLSRSTNHYIEQLPIALEPRSIPSPSRSSRLDSIAQNVQPTRCTRLPSGPQHLAIHHLTCTIQLATLNWRHRATRTPDNKQWASTLQGRGHELRWGEYVREYQPSDRHCGGAFEGRGAVQVVGTCGSPGLEEDYGGRHGSR